MSKTSIKIDFVAVSEQAVKKLEQFLELFADMEVTSCVIKREEE